MGELVALACSLHEPCSTRWDGDSEVGGRPAPRAPAQHEPVTPLLVLPKIRRILDVVAQNRAGAALREIRRHAELPPSTCLRLLQNLVAEGFLDRRGDRYFAGPLLLRWGGRARGGPGCTDRVHQVLERLRDDTGETAALFVRDGWRRIVAGLAPGRHPEEEPFELGQALPLHAGSAGWVFLAFDEPGGWSAVEPAPGDSTGYGPLVGVLAEVRARGWALGPEGWGGSVAALCTPVFAPTGRLAAVIGIGGSACRYPVDPPGSWVAVLAEAARRLSGSDASGLVRDVP